MPSSSSGEAHDAMRRTRLATERTYLAWWRTGLTALAVEPFAPRTDLAFAALGVLLGLATIIIILAQPG